MVKNLPANAGDTGLILGWEDPPMEKERAAHSNILAWKIPWIVSHGLQPTRGD